MLKDLEQINHVRSSIISLEMEISVLEGDYTMAKMHLYNLGKLQKEYEFNLSILKKRKVVVVAAQYKNTVEDLAKVIHKIKHYERAIVRITRDKKIKMKAKKFLVEKYERLKHKLDNKKVLLKFEPRKGENKRDGE